MTEVYFEYIVFRVKCNQLFKPQESMTHNSYLCLSLKTSESEGQKCTGVLRKGKKQFSGPTIFLSWPELS